MRQSPQSVEEHGRELNEDDCEKEEDQNDSNRLEVKILFHNNDLKEKAK